MSCGAVTGGAISSRAVFDGVISGGAVLSGFAVLDEYYKILMLGLNIN